MIAATAQMIKGTLLRLADCRTRMTSVLSFLSFLFIPAPAMEPMMPEMPPMMMMRAEPKKETVPVVLPPLEAPDARHTEPVIKVPDVQPVQSFEPVRKSEEPVLRIPDPELPLPPAPIDPPTAPRA